VKNPIGTIIAVKEAFEARTPAPPPLARGAELIPATFTGFDHVGELDLGAVERQAEALVAGGARRVFVNGTTGEFASLSVSERIRLADRWCDVADSALGVIVHVGHTSLPDARHMAARAEARGAAGIAAITPFFFRPTTPQRLVAFTARVAAAAPSTPFFHYHMPSMTHVRLPAARVLELSAEQIPTFAGMKFTHDDLIEYAACLAIAGDELEVLFGRDELLLPALAEGARGAVGTCYSFAQPLFERIATAFAEGELEASNTAQAQARQLIETGLALGGLPAFKQMIDMVGVPCGPCRPPLAAFDPEAQGRLREALERAGVL
jgi:N-acetylneuraminate lyase